LSPPRTPREPGQPRRLSSRRFCPVLPTQDLARCCLLDRNRRQPPPARSSKPPVTATLLKRFGPLRKTNPLSFVRRGHRAPLCKWNQTADRCLNTGSSRRISSFHSSRSRSYGTHVIT